MGTLLALRDGLMVVSNWDSHPENKPLVPGLIPSVVRSSVDAQAPLGGHRAITSVGLHVTQETLELLYGITVGAANTGQNVIVVRKGKLEEDSWNWIPNAPIFSVTDGILTQNLPSSGPIRQVAWAITPILINVHFGPTIYQ